MPRFANDEGNHSGKPQQLKAAGLASCGSDINELTRDAADNSGANCRAVFALVGGDRSAQRHLPCQEPGATLRRHLAAAQRDGDAIANERIDERRRIAGEYDIAAGRLRRPINQRRRADRLGQRSPSGSSLGQLRMQRENLLQRGRAIRAHHRAGAYHDPSPPAEPRNSHVGKSTGRWIARDATRESALSRPIHLGPGGIDTIGGELRPSAGRHDQSFGAELCRRKFADRKGPSPSLATTSQLARVSIPATCAAFQSAASRS